MRNADCCLLLTACVNPNGMEQTMLQDVDERKRQYIEALQFYLREVEEPIVFVENTGFDIGVFFSEYRRLGRLECFSFNGNNYNRSFGKGYGEALIIKYAYEHSAIMKCKRYVAKITGRLIIRNIRNIIESWYLKKDNIVRCDMSIHNGIYSMVLIINPYSLYLIISQDGKRINDSKDLFFERVVYNSIIKRKYLVIPFFSPTKIDGVSGSFNKKYYVRSFEDNLLTNLSIASQTSYRQGRMLAFFIYTSLFNSYNLYIYVKRRCSFLYKFIKEYFYKFVK